MKARRYGLDYRIRPISRGPQQGSGSALVVGAFSASGAILDQVRPIFAALDIRIVLVDEIEVSLIAPVMRLDLRAA
jgi:hypothetical protein